MGSNLSVTVRPAEEGQDYKVVVFDGEFDKAGHAEVREMLDEIVETLEVKSLVFDFTKLKFINSEGIGYLMEVHTHLVQRGKEFAIVGIGSHIADVFEAVGINEIIPVYDDLSGFINR